MTRNNQKQYVRNMRITDNDATSLYPTAIVNVCYPNDQGGFSCGKPKVIPERACVSQEAFEQWIFETRPNTYFVQVDIIHIERKLSFPVLSNNTDGNRNWTNEPEELHDIVIDNITLRDAIEFQGARYQPKEGITLTKE